MWSFHVKILIQYQQNASLLESDNTNILIVKERERIADAKTARSLRATKFWLLEPDLIDLPGNIRTAQQIYTMRIRAIDLG